jgi:hypothetical protein
MTKAEMEAHSYAYQERMQAVRVAENAGLYGAAVAAAISAWQHIDGMLQYRKKYESHDTISIESVEVVLEFAPLLLDARSIAALEQLLDDNRRINSEISRDKLAEARSRLRETHRIWTYIELHPNVEQTELWAVSGANKKEWQAVVGAWTKMGLVHQTERENSFTVALATRMGQIVSAKCPSCGTVVQGPKGMFVEPAHCTECRHTGLFVLLANQWE